MGDRKTEIIDLAGDLIRTRGFDSFSYNDLSHTLGIRKASIHHHFPKKADLGQAFLERASQTMETMIADLESSRDSATTHLYRFIAMGNQLSAGCTKMCAITSLQTDRRNIPEDMREQLMQIELLELKYITEVLRHGYTTGEMRFAGSIEAQAMVVLSAIKGAMQYSLNQGPEFFETSIQQIMTLLEAN